MNGSFKIGRAFGIPIYLHWTFLVVLWIAWRFNSLPWIIVVFGCVLLHELGHSLVARRFGVRVIDIVFWPLGGMARMSSMPEVARIEGLVAIAGPAVNFLLAGLGLAAFLVQGIALSEPSESIQGIAGALVRFTAMNLALGTFNLLPAFPMDGGRVLRAFFGRNGDWVRATERAVRVGRFVALLMLIAALWLSFSAANTCVLLLIPVFIWMEGGKELIHVRLRHGLAPFGGVARGVGDFRGASRKSEREAEWSTSAPPIVPEESPASGARRPAHWDASPAKGGFDEGKIKDLEGFQGRLRRYPSEE